MWKFTGQRRPEIAIEPMEGQESVWDYPRPPICVPDKREVKVLFQGETVASTRNAIRVLETASPPTIYIPRTDINLEWLREKATGSHCEWKGGATYWDLQHPRESPIRNVGWSYEAPTNAFESIQGYLSFYPALLQCFVDQQLVRPQPGGFYGGWVTDEIIGPYKGAAGTSGW